MDTQIIAVATEDGLVYCGECADKLQVELYGSSVYHTGQEDQLADWAAICSHCNLMLYWDYNE